MGSIPTVSMSFAPFEALETFFLLHLWLGSAFAGRLRSELRQAITSRAEHDDSRGFVESC